GGHVMDAFEKSRDEGLQSAYGKGIHGHAQRCSDKSRVAGEPFQRGALKGNFRGFHLAALRFGKKQEYCRQKKPRDTGQHKRNAPAETYSERPCQRYAESTAHGKGKIKDGEHASTALDGKGVGDERGRDGGVAGFTDADNRMAKQELGIVMHQPGQQGKTTPDNNAENDNLFPGEAISKASDQRSREHVTEEKCADNQPVLLVIDPEFILHQRLDADHRIAINVIEQVESGKDCQHGIRIGFARHAVASLYRDTETLPLMTLMQLIDNDRACAGGGYDLLLTLSVSGRLIGVFR